MNLNDFQKDTKELGEIAKVMKETGFVDFLVDIHRQTCTAILDASDAYPGNLGAAIASNGILTVAMNMIDSVTGTFEEMNMDVESIASLLEHKSVLLRQRIKENESKRT